MDKKEEYTFEDIDKFQDELMRIIYMWRRYKGTRTVDGKKFNSLELSDLKTRISEYLSNHNYFNYDDGIVKFE